MPFLNGAQAYCGSCKEPCDIGWVDDGIGPVEFWGAKSWHHDWNPVSDCCEEHGLWTDAECTVEFNMNNWEPHFEEPDDDDRI